MLYLRGKNQNNILVNDYYIQEKHKNGYVIVMILDTKPELNLCLHVDIFEDAYILMEYLIGNDTRNKVLYVDDISNFMSTLNTYKVFKNDKRNN